jgi:hypothetical protein
MFFFHNYVRQQYFTWHIFIIPHVYHTPEFLNMKLQKKNSMNEIWYSQDRSINIVTRPRDRQPGFDCWQEQQRVFSLHHSIQTDLMPTQPHIQWVLRALSPGVKWLRCEARSPLPPKSS